MSKNTKYAIALHAEVATTDEAAELAQMALAILSRQDSIVLTSIEKYWKIPSQYRICMSFDTVVQTESFFLDILGLLGSGWETGGYPRDRWAVWNFGPATDFAIPHVKWANVDAFRVPHDKTL